MLKREQRDCWKQYILPAHHSFAKKKRNVTASHTCSPPRGKKKPLLAKKIPCDRYSKSRRSKLPLSLTTLFPPTCAKLFPTFHVAYGSFPTFFSLSENEQAGYLSPSLFQVFSIANAGVQCNFVQGEKSHLIFCKGYCKDIFSAQSSNITSKCSFRD